MSRTLHVFATSSRPDPYVNCIAHAVNELAIANVNFVVVAEREPAPEASPQWLAGTVCRNVLSQLEALCSGSYLIFAPDGTALKSTGLSNSTGTEKYARCLDILNRNGTPSGRVIEHEELVQFLYSIDDRENCIFDVTALKKSLLVDVVAALLPGPGPDTRSFEVLRTQMHSQADLYHNLGPDDFIYRKLLNGSVIRSLAARATRARPLQIIENLCRRLPHFVAALATRHDKRACMPLHDEYDLQDLMHALLRLHFDDVRAEEHTPSYAGNHARMDFLLKNEKIAVELKMTRERLGSTEVVNQLAVDEKRYRSHPDCKTLVCFVYDPDGRCQNPVALESDASESNTPLRVVVIVSSNPMIEPRS